MEYFPRTIYNINNCKAKFDQIKILYSNFEEKPSSLSCNSRADDRYSRLWSISNYISRYLSGGLHSLVLKWCDVFEAWRRNIPIEGSLTTTRSGISTTGRTGSTTLTFTSIPAPGPGPPPLAGTRSSTTF